MCPEIPARVGDDVPLIRSILQRASRPELRAEIFQTQGTGIAALVFRFRSSHHFAAPSSANFGIKGTLAISILSSAAYGFEVPTTRLPRTDRNFKSAALPGSGARAQAARAALTWPTIASNAAGCVI